MSAIELRTERLLLRQWRDEDLEPMAAINREPDVHEFLSSPPDRAMTAESIAAARAHWAAYDYGFFAVEVGQGELASRLLGFCGVHHPTFVPELAHRTELGYRFGRFAWGRGFATEAALACRDDAFERARLPDLISLIDPANTRSKRVAEKGGFTPGETVTNPRTGLDVVVWTQQRPT